MRDNRGVVSWGELVDETDKNETAAQLLANPPKFPDLKETQVKRKEQPAYSGVLAYFPDAILEVARISKIGNDQHNPGQPLHWAREKSTDQLDAATRHIIDHAKGLPLDSDGGYHLAKAAWRCLAELQLILERTR